MEPALKGPAPRIFPVLTCTPAGKLGFVVTRSDGTMAALFIATIFTIFFSITAPQIGDAVSIRTALEFIPSAASRRVNVLGEKL